MSTASASKKAKPAPKASAKAPAKPRKSTKDAIARRHLARRSPAEVAVNTLAQATFDAHRLVHLAQHNDDVRPTLPQPLRVHCLRIARRTLDAAWSLPPMRALEAVVGALPEGAAAVVDASGGQSTPAYHELLVRQTGAAIDASVPTMATLPAHVERVHDLLHGAMTLLTIDDRELKRDTNHERLAAFLLTREALALLHRIDALPEVDAALGDMTRALEMAGALFAKDPTRVTRRYSHFSH